MRPSLLTMPPTKNRLYTLAISLDEKDARRLEELLSAPFVTELVSAADVPRLAWVVNERGVRNVWTAAAPGFEPRPLTRFEDDDGRPLCELQLSADGRWLIFIRGGESNRQGEHPNPDSNPRGAERTTWAVETSGGEPRRIARAASALLTPDGERLLFTHGGQVLEIPLPASNDATPSEPKELFRSRGNTGSLACCPSGRFISFISHRRDHSFVGVFDRQRHRIVWIAPEVDIDGHPVFSPDGSRIAFVRYPGLLLDEEPWDPTAGAPFEIWVGDPASGEGRRVWRSPGADGDYPQHHVNEPLAWAGNDRLVFVSEHEGWIHLYAVPATGGRVIDLTPGTGEVDASVISRDGAMLYFSSNHGDIHRRHLWRVPVTGGPPELQTPGQGIETDPVRLAGSSWLACRASGSGPPAVELVEVLRGQSGNRGGRRLALSPATTATRAAPWSKESRPARVVGWRAADGVEVYGQLFLPPGETPAGGRPAVIFLHGGPVNQMLLGCHPQHYYGLAWAFNQFLAQSGFVVLAVNFRAGTGYGRAFRQAAGQGSRGASEYQDVVDAAKYLARRKEVDSERIGLWGGSYGGYLTALGLARDSALFAAGVAIHGVFDRAYQLSHSRFHDKPIDSELLELARRSSPIADLETWTSPVLLVHGDDDPWVPFSHTVDLVQRLRERQVHVETLVFPDEGHDFLRHVTWRRTFEAAAEFLIRFLLRPTPSS